MRIGVFQVYDEISALKVLQDHVESKNLEASSPESVRYCMKYHERCDLLCDPKVFLKSQVDVQYLCLFSLFLLLI